MSIVFLFFAKQPLLALKKHRPSFQSFPLAGFHVHFRFADRSLVLLERSGEAWRGTNELVSITKAAAIEASGAIDLSFVELTHQEGEEDAAARVLALSDRPFDREDILLDCRYRIDVGRVF
ncbi:MAG: hypothetical protein NWQ23_01545 [Yoonia sp.]|uniref:hypothetical protein n=1 Tax=Yoonia sp. TaxID=2212373 RepID=UPI00273F4838|nr:hypothetical protein [Yoonia sp.]MDP5084074.1 hypothetical protein [Yoonia sp.]